MSGNGNNGKRYTAQEFIDAIPGSGGIVTKIAAKVGCSWNTAKKYIDTHPTVLQAYQDEKERLLDTAESNIKIMIEAFDIKTSKWYLTMKGSERGYAPMQKREVTGDLQVTIDWDDEDDQS